MTTFDNHIQKGLRKLTSLDHVQAYAATQDKYIYARDTLVMALGNELPLNVHLSDDLVETYEALLENQSTIDRLLGVSK